MTTFQKVIKYLAIALAIFLTASIIGGILSAVGLIGGIFGGDAVAEELKTYSVSSEIHSLEIKVNAADFTIKQGDSFSVESNLKHLTVEEKNGVLTINETKKLTSTYNGAVLTLYVPADTAFEKADIITGAGRLNVDSLSASVISLELGAGDVSIDSLTATSDIDIDGGAGRITISGGALHDLDMDMGVGQLNLTSALTGKSALDLGVGESNITVIGQRDDYTLDIEKGIGNITVDGTSVSEMDEQGDGKNIMEISGGVGAIRVEFQDTNAE